MPWIGPVISAGASLVGQQLSKSDRKRASALDKRAVEMGDDMVEMAERWDSWAADRWGFYKEQAAPVDIAILNEAMSYYREGPADDVTRAKADVNTAFDRAEDIRMRQLRRYGEVDPLSGQAQAAGRENALERAKAEVAIANKTRLQQEEMAFQKLGIASDVGERALNNAYKFGSVSGDLRSSAASIYTGGAQRAADSAAGVQEFVMDLAGRVPWEDLIPGGAGQGAEASGIVEGEWGASGQPGHFGNTSDWGYATPQWNLPPGYADGGLVQQQPALPVQPTPVSAVPVAGRQVQGPGTPTSDSVPARVDGQQEAALSSGEFVIPADVVRAKGTEFFEKLIASVMQPQPTGA